MRQRELQGGRADIQPERRAGRVQPLRMPQRGGIDRGVVVGGAGAACVAEQAGAVRASRQDRHIALLRLLQQRARAVLFQQGVAAGQHHAVERKTRQYLQGHILLVDAQPDRTARAGRLQLRHRRQGLLQGLAQHVGVVVAVGQRTDVVQQQHVDVVGAQAFQAGGERTPHTIGAVIERGAPPGHCKAVAAGNSLGVVVDAAADLGRQRVVRARYSGQASAQARFAQP